MATTGVLRRTRGVLPQWFRRGNTSTTEEGGSELRPILARDEQSHVRTNSEECAEGDTGSNSISSISEDTSSELRSFQSENEDPDSDENIDGGSWKKQVWEKIRRLLVVCLLVLLILFAASAYSLVGPFLPIEVIFCS